MNNVRKWNEVLRHEREVRGFSQEEVAREIGTDQKVVSRWERGISRPSPYFRRKLIELFGKHADELGLIEQLETSGPSLDYDHTPPALPLEPTSPHSSLLAHDA